MYEQPTSSLSSDFNSVPFSTSLDSFKHLDFASSHTHQSIARPFEQPDIFDSATHVFQRTSGDAGLFSLNSYAGKGKSRQHEPESFPSLSNSSTSPSKQHDELTGLNDRSPFVGDSSNDTHPDRASRGKKKPKSNSFSSTYGYGLVDAAKSVAWAAGYYPRTLKDVPNLGGFNWGNDMVKAPEVWSAGVTGAGVTVAVIDSGVDIYHPDLAENIWYNTGEIAGDGIDNDGNGYTDDITGWNFALNNNDITDRVGHGTHVSGTIAAANNGYGTTGVAYNAQIMPLSLADYNGDFMGNVAAAIYYAVDNGARVINMSFGSTYNNPQVLRAIAYAASQDVITIYSAGNDGKPAPGQYPANYAVKYGVTVGAVDYTGKMASFSNRAGFDSRLNYVVAPGQDIWSTVPISTGSYYDSYNGTSMAAPHVAGVAALMVSVNPEITAKQAQWILSNSTVSGYNRNSVEFVNKNAIAPEVATDLLLPTTLIPAQPTLNIVQSPVPPSPVVSRVTSSLSVGASQDLLNHEEREYATGSDRVFEGFYTVQDLLSKEVNSVDELLGFELIPA